MERLLLYKDPFLNQASSFENHGYITSLKCTAGRKSQAILWGKKGFRSSCDWVTKNLKGESSSTYHALYF